MGNCVSKKSKKAFNQTSISPEILCVYPRSGQVKIRFKNHLKKVTAEKVIDFTVTDPSNISCDRIHLMNSKMLISMCVLPGLDPKSISNKVCQDNAIYLHDEDSVLITLLDGHGSEGEKVVNFCLDVISNIYSTRKDLKVKHKQSTPNDLISLLAETCDKQLNEKSNGINVLFSGCGSVGDSRAILASSKSPSKLPVPNAALSDKETLQEIRQRRNSFPDTKVWPIQLTLDQKPNDAEERKRIESHGGRVQRLVDEFHNRIGPYRVWEKKGNYPGLAMSRSIGDVAAKRIGVISTPIFTQHAIDSENDLFLIIASDGVWDVMANEDVANFVECYRTACKANVVDNRNTEINTQNACIAQILAEEARIRWYSIVEEEDVIIDDISCVIIELQIMESARDLNFIKSPAPLVEGILKSSTEFELVRAPSILEVNIRDPKRSSIVSESNPKVEIN